MSKLLLIPILLTIFIIVIWQIDRAFFHPYFPDREMQIRDDVTTTKFTIPKDEISCASASGVWKKIGIRPKEECNLPTTDGGKICSGSNQCEGICLADISTEQIRAGIKGKPFKTTGKCSDWVTVVGCKAYVEDGWASVVCMD